MSYKILKNGKIKVMGDYNFNGKRYRPSRTIETDLDGIQLKALVATIEAELYEETKLKASDPNKISELDIVEAREWYIDTNDLEQNTIDWYRDYIGKRVGNYFKNKKVVAITETDARNFFEFLESEKGINTNKPLSQKTKKHYLTALHALFEELVAKNVIKENPFKSIKIKVSRRLTKNRYYNISEVQKHLEILSEHAPVKYFLFYVLTVMCGLRPAEARGLKWNKINWIERKILIDESLAATDAGYITKGTKNEEPREIDLIDLAISLLQLHYKNEQEKSKELKLKTDIFNNYVFTNSRGEHIGESTFRNWWKNFCERHHLRYVPPYGLRHTTATMLAYNNIPLANIAQQMGHLDTSTTLVYIHAVEEGKKDVFNVLNGTVKMDLLKVK